MIRVNNQLEAKQHIQKLRESHPKACHVCFAWRIGNTEYEDRFSDDGEPNNSAGKPIFGQIVKFELTNVLIAVVRYYGGTNLGVGGLITAYKSAASEAIESGVIIEKHAETEIKIYFEPADTGEAMMHLNRTGATITEHNVDKKGHFVLFSTLLAKQEEIIELFNQTGKFEIELIK